MLIFNEGLVEISTFFFVLFVIFHLNEGSVGIFDHALIVVQMPHIFVAIAPAVIDFLDWIIPNIDIFAIGVIRCLLVGFQFYDVDSYRCMDRIEVQGPCLSWGV